MRTSVAAPANFRGGGTGSGAAEQGGAAAEHRGKTAAPAREQRGAVEHAGGSGRTVVGANRQRPEAEVRARGGDRAREEAVGRVGPERERKKKKRERGYGYGLIYLTHYIIYIYTYITYTYIYTHIYL